MFNRRRWRRRRSFLKTIYSFAIAWAVLSFLFPLYRLSGLLWVFGISALLAYFLGQGSKKQSSEDEREAPYAANAVHMNQAKNPANTKTTSERTGGEPSAKPKVKVEDKAKEKPAEEIRTEPAKKKSYGPKIDPIIEESNRALSEMGRLYMSIQDEEIKAKINEIMKITDKIAQDAIEDPSDIPQIKKFFSYYLPTTIKLLNSYDRMSSQGIEGENIDKSMANIKEMLDVAIAAYKKRLDSLFENQALDIETDIEVMNQMLESEGLKGENDFSIKSGAAAQAVQKEKE